MEQAIPWVLIALLGAAIVWRVDRYVHRRLGARVGDQEVILTERRTAALIAERTVEATIALKNAELTKQTAEVHAAAALIDELRDDRIKAERKIIAARADAEQKLAVENVRADHEAARTSDDEDILEKYERYMVITRDRGVSHMAFTDFVRAMNIS